MDYKIKTPAWFREIEENHKSNWHANSKGGEPNHRNESKEGKNG